jgi:hypothetical protein
MKTRLSTPSHNSAADANANSTPPPRSNTPSLDLAAGRKQARPPPANPYRTPTCSTSENARPPSENDRPTSPPQGDSTSPTLMSEKGVNDDDHRPPPPLAPDERTATRHSTSGEEEDVDRLVYFTARGHHVTPLANAIARDPVHMGDPVHTVAMATKFPPKFLQAVEEQTVMLGIGEEVESAPTGGGRRESCEDQAIMAPPQPGGFQDLLDSVISGDAGFGHHGGQN